MRLAWLLGLALASLPRAARAQPELLVGRIDDRPTFELIFANPPTLYRAKGTGKGMISGVYLEIASDKEYPLGASVENGKIAMAVRDFTADGKSTAKELFILHGTVASDGGVSGTWERVGSAGRRPFRADREPLLRGARASVETRHRETKRKFPSATRVKRSCHLALDEFPLKESDPAAAAINAVVEKVVTARLAPYRSRVTRCSSPGATLIASVSTPTFASDALVSLPVEWQFTYHQRPEKLPPDDNPTDTPDYSWGPVTSEGTWSINLDLRSRRELDPAALLGSSRAVQALLARSQRQATRRGYKVKPTLAALGVYPRYVQARLDTVERGYDQQVFVLSQRQLRRLASPASPLGRALPAPTTKPQGGRAKHEMPP
jgi:hypothetical protein